MCVQAHAQEQVVSFDQAALCRSALPLHGGQSVEMPLLLTARAKLCRNVALLFTYEGEGATAEEVHAHAQPQPTHIQRHSWVPVFAVIAAESVASRRFRCLCACVAT